MLGESRQGNEFCATTEGGEGGSQASAKIENAMETKENENDGKADRWRLYINARGVWRRERQWR